MWLFMKKATNTQVGRCIHEKWVSHKSCLHVTVIAFLCWPVVITILVTNRFCLCDLFVTCLWLLLLLLPLISLFSHRNNTYIYFFLSRIYIRSEENWGVFGRFLWLTFSGVFSCILCQFERTFALHEIVKLLMRLKKNPSAGSQYRPPRGW